MTRYEVELTDEQARGFLDGWHRQAVELALHKAIRANPPKPPEPTEFGAMVKDRDGVLWLRTDTGHAVRNPWLPNRGFESCAYAEIDAVEVIRGGAS